MSTFNLTGFQPGFGQPPIGAHLLVQGRYIIDCGHPSFTTELHAMSFVAWAETAGSGTTVRAYYNPYRDTEHYNPDFDMIGHVSDTSRFSDMNTETFPKYLVSEVLRIQGGTSTQLHS